MGLKIDDVHSILIDMAKCKEISEKIAHQPKVDLEEMK